MNPDLYRLRLRLRVPDLPNLYCPAPQFQLTVDTILASALLRDHEFIGLLLRQVLKVAELLKYLTGAPVARLSHLERLNPRLFSTQKILSLPVKRPAIALDDEFVDAIFLLPGADQAALFNFLNAKPQPHTAITHLRDTVFPNGRELRAAQLTTALTLVGEIGAKFREAISKDLMRIWLKARAECVPDSGVYPAAQMEAVNLKAHYEKHCCNQHGNNRPAEAAWWAAHLRYKITQQDLLDCGIADSANLRREIFPHDPEVNGASRFEKLFATGSAYCNAALVDMLWLRHGQTYKAQIEGQFQRATKAFIMFHGGKIQLAARKGLQFLIATYNPDPPRDHQLVLMSSYFPNDLETHWTDLRADLVWELRA
ncbi:MAG: hypothetical protein V4505_28115 [Pseudomonadota bacterium]